MRRCVGLVIAMVAACKGDSAQQQQQDPPPPGPITCEPAKFAVSSPVPEASGAGWMMIDGKLGMVVVSDSGNHGAYAVIDPDSGETREEGQLPLGEGGDDIEGVDARGDTLYGLTSAGWMRVWKREGKGFRLVDGPYALGAVTLPKKGGLGDKPPEGDGMVCPVEGTNCGRNYEGLCLAPKPPPAGSCIGFAAAKADGHLYCLTEEGGKLVVHHDRAIAVTEPGHMADCAFSDDNTLWAGNNLIGLSKVYRVDGWQDTARAKAVEVAQLGVGFPEVIAARGDALYRFSDTGGSPSLLAKFRCRPAAR